MNRVKFPLMLAILATAIAVQPALAQSASAPQQDPNQATPTQTSPSTQTTPSATPSTSGAMESQTFTGKVTKSGDKYVLKDDATRTSYTLDDQDRAKQFEGKSVKVTGKLDPASNTIVVSSIEPGM